MITINNISSDQALANTYAIRFRLILADIAHHKATQKNTSDRLRAERELMVDMFKDSSIKILK